jgi:hypothetical protein
MFRRTRAFLRRLKTTGEDRRAHPRHEIDIATKCHSLSDDSDLPARIRNVSRSGVRLVVQRPVTEGTMIRMDLPGLPEGLHTTFLACVTNVTALPDGQWALGCVFSLELSDSEIRLLGGEKTPTSGPDQRAWVRHPARGTISYRHVPDDHAPVRSAELVDLSPAGVGLLANERLEAGTAVTLAMHAHDGRPGREMLACVVYLADRPDGKWAVGCNFLHELSEKQLTELVLYSTR